MFTATVILLILAFVCAAIALFGAYERINLTALGLLFVIIALLIGK